MTPLDFLDLASQLLSERRFPAAAAMRTASSRAYYAAFLSAREVMSSAWHQPEFVGGNEHRLLQQCLMNSNVPEAFAIGKLLEILHERRKSADYDLADPDFDSQQSAEICIERAHDVIAKLNKCSNGILSAQIRAGITQYRRLRQV